MRNLGSSSCIEEFGECLWHPDRQNQYVSAGFVTHTQWRMAPDTPDEICAVWNGHCPKCGDKLTGDNRLFCVRDQYWWEPPRL
jgi:hypothetical protein